MEIEFYSVCNLKEEKRIQFSSIIHNSLNVSNFVTFIKNSIFTNFKKRFQVTQTILANYK
jgi:hypothetical protein